MNSTKDKLENETPHFGNTLLAAVASAKFDTKMKKIIKLFEVDFLKLINMTKLKQEVSKTAIAAEMLKEAKIMYENSYDKERLLQAYMNAVHNTFKKLRAEKEA